MHSSSTASSRWSEARRVVVVEPLRVVVDNAPQAFVTSASVFMQAQFSAHGGFLPVVIAWVLAIGIEWLYLRGFASAQRSVSPWATALNWAALITSVAFGILYGSLHYAVLDMSSIEVRVWLILSHVLPVAAVLFCAMGMHRDEALRKIQREAEARQAEREREQHEAEMERKRRERLLEIELEAEAERRRIALEAEAKRSEDQRQVERLKLRREVSQQPVTVTPVTSVTPQQDAVKPSVTLAEIHAMIATCDGNKAEAARRLGISRPMLYKLLSQAEEAN